MKRTRLGVTAALLGSAMLGSVSGGGWREAYPSAASAGCDLARGFATAALIGPRSAAPAERRTARRLASEGAAEAWTAGAGANPFGAARHGNLGLGAIVGDTADLNGPRTTFVRQPAFGR